MSINGAPRILARVQAFKSREILITASCAIALQNCHARFAMETMQSIGINIIIKAPLVGLKVIPNWTIYSVNPNDDFPKNAKP